MRVSFFFLYARTRAREIFDTRNRSLCLSRVSCKCLSLSDLNFERDLVRFQRGGKGKGRGEKRGDRAKRNDEIHGRGGGVFDDRSRGRRGSEAGGGEIQRNVIAGRSEIHPNGGAFSPRKKRTRF